jgi:hypothetical protein
VFFVVVNVLVCVVCVAEHHLGEQKINHFLFSPFFTLVWVTFCVEDSWFGGAWNLQPSVRFSLGEPWVPAVVTTLWFTLSFTLSIGWTLVGKNACFITSPNNIWAFYLIQCPNNSF